MFEQGQFWNTPATRRPLKYALTCSNMLLCQWVSELQGDLQSWSGQLKRHLTNRRRWMCTLITPCLPHIAPPPLSSLQVIDSTLVVELKPCGHQHPTHKSWKLITKEETGWEGGSDSAKKCLSIIGSVNGETHRHHLWLSFRRNALHQTWSPVKACIPFWKRIEMFWSKNEHTMICYFCNICISNNDIA